MCVCYWILLFVSILFLNNLKWGNSKLEFDEFRPVIDISRLVVVTVIDLNNQEVTSDSMTLFRSIRTFGGKLNTATLQACIPHDSRSMNDITTSKMVSKLVHELATLGVEITWMQTTSPFTFSMIQEPKTLNKFHALKQVDLLRFDYILWLDEDMVYPYDIIVRYL